MKTLSYSGWCSGRLSSEHEARSVNDFKHLRSCSLLTPPTGGQALAEPPPVGWSIFGVEFR